MKKIISLAALFLLLQHTPLFPTQNTYKIWQEFVSLFKEGRLTAKHIRPHKEFPIEQLTDMLNRFRPQIPWEEMQPEPETIVNENQLNFLVPLTTTEGGKYTYCFSFILEGDKWYFQHLEGIFIRLDKIGAIPTVEFPDLPEQQKAWIRQEGYWSKMVWLFNTTAKNSGTQAAFNLFPDGMGYFLAAKAWVPFVPPSRAFILYLCWEQSKLIGNRVTLENLEEKEALVRIESIYFALYKRTAHLRTQIGFEDYKKIFETIWLDRSLRAGWKLNIKYDFDKSEVLLHFTRED